MDPGYYQFYERYYNWYLYKKQIILGSIIYIYGILMGCYYTLTDNILLSFCGIIIMFMGLLIVMYYNIVPKYISLAESDSDSMVDEINI